jgi:hypothetical protein
LNDAIGRLMDGPELVLAQLEGQAQKLVRTIGQPHVNNSLADYRQWRTETLEILGEQDAAWVTQFTRADELPIPDHDSQPADALRAWIEEDIELLRVLGRGVQP